MATTKLSLYNGALRVFGSRPLSSVTESRSSRRILDTIYDNGFIDYVLKQGFWNFAIRTVCIEYDSSVEPDFGYKRAFPKPSDWVRTAAVSADENFDMPLLEYDDTAGFWWSNEDAMYIKYVSNGNDYGGDLANWTPDFTLFAERYMAHEACSRIKNNSITKREIYGLMKQALTEARAADAMNQPAKIPPAGSWARSRRSRGSKYNSRYR